MCCRLTMMKILSTVGLIILGVVAVLFLAPILLWVILLGARIPEWQKYPGYALTASRTPAVTLAEVMCGDLTLRIERNDKAVPGRMEGISIGHPPGIIELDYLVVSRAGSEVFRVQEDDTGSHEQPHFVSSISSPPPEEYIYVTDTAGYKNLENSHESWVAAVSTDHGVDTETIRETAACYTDHKDNLNQHLTQPLVAFTVYRVREGKPERFVCSSGRVIESNQGGHMLVDGDAQKSIAIVLADSTIRPMEDKYINPTVSSEERRLEFWGSCVTDAGLTVEEYSTKFRSNTEYLD